MLRKRIKDLPLWARVVVRASNLKFSWRRLADYVKEIPWCTYGTIIRPNSTNHIIVMLIHGFHELELRAEIYVHEDHTHSFQSAVLVHEVHVLTSHIYIRDCVI